MDARRSETWFFVALLAVALFLTWSILAPYVGMLVFAGTLAFLFQPPYQKLLRVFRYESLAAFATIIIVTLIVFVPLGFFGVRIFGEATALYASLTAHGGFDFGAALTNFLHAHFKNFPIPNLTFNVSNYVQQGLTWLIQNLGSLFSGVTQIFFTAFLSLLGLFYFLKDGERLKNWVTGIVPLAPEYSEDIVREMETVGSSVVKGTLMVAVIQGIVMGIGFFLFGIPDPTFWGTLVVFTSIIPIVGTWLVVVPAIAYLLFTGQTALGIGLAIWSAILVNLIYNVLSPQLMHRGVHLHPYLILLSVLGGIGLFGPIGFLTGPLIMALLFSLLKIYTKLTLGTRRKE
ncbi:MAG: AI-2E family transporter [Minisyncoccia bacterium]|jgi:predicted PurR-regulated permease PerM